MDMEAKARELNQKTLAIVRGHLANQHGVCDITPCGVCIAHREGMEEATSPEAAKILFNAGMEEATKVQVTPLECKYTNFQLRNMGAIEAWKRGAHHALESKDAAIREKIKE